MRIDVIGLPASGKTTFAAEVANKLSIPHIHIDRFWFAADGHLGPRGVPNDDVRASIRQKVTEAIKAESWVSDGTYLHVQDIISERADVIIFLDIPLITRLCSHIRRILSKSNRHPELKFWDEITFIFEMIRREFASKPKLLKFVAENKNKIIVLRSRSEMNKYIENLKMI